MHTVGVFIETVGAVERGSSVSIDYKGNVKTWH
jgi:hypothetical protein